MGGGGGGASQLELAGLLRLPATRAAVKRGALRQSRIFGNRGKRREASRRRLRGHGRVIVASKSGDRRRGASRRRRGASRDRRSIRLRGRRARGEVAADISLDRPGGHLRLHLPSKAPETPPVDIPPFSTLRLDLLLDLLLRLLVRVRHLVHPFSLRINPQGRVCGTRVRCESSRAKRVWSRDARSDRRCRRSQRPTSFTACRIVPRRIREPHGDTTVRTEVNPFPTLLWNKACENTQLLSQVRPGAKRRGVGSAMRRHQPPSARWRSSKERRGDEFTESQRKAANPRCVELNGQVSTATRRPCDPAHLRPTRKQATPSSSDHCFKE